METVDHVEDSQAVIDEASMQMQNTVEASEEQSSDKGDGVEMQAASAENRKEPESRQKEAAEMNPPSALRKSTAILGQNDAADSLGNAAARVRHEDTTAAGSDIQSDSSVASFCPSDILPR